MKKVSMIVLAVCAGVFALVASIQAADMNDVTGIWKSIDEKTGKATGFWKFEIKDGVLYGTLESWPGGKLSDVCTACKEDTAAWANKPIKGTPWLVLKKWNGKEWEKGYIIDSGKGEKYRASVFVDGGNLKVRGYLGPFYRTQTWKKSNAAEAAAGW